MKKYIIYSITFFLTISCFGQSSDDLTEFRKILMNQTISLLEFSKVAHFIDNDIESLWAYAIADSLLGTIDLNGNQFDSDLPKIYSAYTYIFYGMCYSQTIKAISRGENYSLKGLWSTVIPYQENNKLTEYELTKIEIMSIAGMINFYKVNSMPKFQKMNNVYASYYKIMEEVNDQFTKNEAFKIVTLRNKKLYFETISNLVIDLYFLNNQETKDADINNYISKLRTKGETLDEIPDDFFEISNLTKREHLKYFSVCTQIQTEMLQLLTEEIKILMKRNE